MTKYILGINPGFGGFNYHDPSACLVKAGKVLYATEEERFTRIKSSPGTPPLNSIESCLHTVGLQYKDIEAIAVGYSPNAWQQRLAMETHQMIESLSPLSKITKLRSGINKFNPHQALSILLESINIGTDIVKRSLGFYSNEIAEHRIKSTIKNIDNIPIYFVEHHDSHAISAFYPSLFETATILVLDGLGEIETTSIWLGNKNKIKKVYSDQLPNSIGYLYAAFTEYLGFKGWEGEGKTMALAPYGKFNQKINDLIYSLLEINDNGFNVCKFIEPVLDSQLSLNLKKAVLKLEELLGVERRERGAPITSIHKDISWAIQNFLEKSVIKLIKKAYKMTGNVKFCFAGGVALNCKLNMVIREQPEVEQLYVQPVASDAGVAIGAALRVSEKLGNFKKQSMPHLYLGHLEEDNTEELLKKWKVRYKRPDNLFEKIAKSISEEKIVMWYNGRPEVGPRALGARSILGDPRSVQVKIKLNQEIKNRETWRPFGPSILKDFAPCILQNFSEHDDAPYMIQAYRVKSEWLTKIPAVIHEADGTTRPHTVTKKHQPDYYHIIKAFYNITEIPLVINTSFNDRGEPLVNTIKQALSHFISSSSDILVINGLWIEKTY